MLEAGPRRGLELPGRRLLASTSTFSLLLLGVSQASQSPALDHFAVVEALARLQKFVFKIFQWQRHDHRAR